MATHSSILAWRIPWTEDPGRLQSMGSQSQTQLSDLAHVKKDESNSARSTPWPSLSSLPPAPTSGPPNLPHPPGPLVTASLQLLHDPSGPCMDTVGPVFLASFHPCVSHVFNVDKPGLQVDRLDVQGIQPRNMSPPPHPGPCRGQANNTASVPFSSGQKSHPLSTHLCTGSSENKVVCAFPAVS